MTREGILGLEPGPELDRLIAERVMGWEEGVEFFRRNGWIIVNGRRIPNRAAGTELDWSPSTDIAAAWEVVKKMLGSGWGCEIYSPNNPCALEDIDKWVVVFAKSELFDYRAKASSAPLAICRAALLAMETNDE